MELVRWSPVGNMSSLRKNMDRPWDRLSGEIPLAKAFGGSWLPSIDVSETKDSFVVKADLPGLAAKDVNISIKGDVLTLKGEKKAEAQEKDEQFYCIERYSGSFRRVLQLPSGVKADKVEATFDKGVLKVTLPKATETKKKIIKVKIK